MDLAQWIELLERTAGLGETVEEAPPDPTLAAGTRGEQRLWQTAIADSGQGEVPIEDLVGSGAGPILAPDAYLAIEVWADCELSAVHALHRIARRSEGSRRRSLESRLASAVEWHLEHTQPDNSTHRPWALHAFLLADDGSGEAALYAETLLGNVLATDARSEPLSRWILADAARELRLAGASAR